MEITRISPYSSSATCRIYYDTFAPRDYRVGMEPATCAAGALVINCGRLYWRNWTSERNGNLELQRVGIF